MREASQTYSIDMMADGTAREEERESFLHRKPERDEIVESIRPLFSENNRNPTNVLLHGPSGSGKTEIIDQLAKDLKEYESVQILRVNCVKARTHFGVLHEILDKKLSCPREGTSTDTVIEELDSKIRGTPTIIVIEDIDMLCSEEVMHNLSRYTRSPLIMTTQDPDVISSFSERIRSRLSGVNSIEFEPYSQKELTDILRDEASKYDTSLLTEEVLMKLSRQSGGDARKAVNDLSLLVQKIDSRNLEEVTDELFEEVLSAVNEEPDYDLNEHQIALKHVLGKSDRPVQMGDLYPEYENLVQEKHGEDEVRTRRTLRRYLNEMHDLGVINIEGTDSSKKYSLQR